MFDLKQFKDKFREFYADEPRVFAAPGRVNLIGEHTDYNEGFVLPFAINYRTYVAAAPRADRLMKVFSQTLGKGAEFDLNEDFSAAEKDWTLYVKGVAAVLQREGFRLAGADILIDSEVPFGAGLSSSAALEIALSLALVTLSGADFDLKQLAFAGQRVEHEFVGVKSGIMDQFASALARRDHALLIDCRSLETAHVPLLLGEARLVVCDTRVKHELASSEYNTRRLECETGVEILQVALPAVKSLRDARAEDLQTFGAMMPENILRRCRHVVTENARTLAAVEALRQNDLPQFGGLMLLSHESLRDDYEVSSTELDFLVAAARKIKGVFGARMTGGGFGGCTVNLVRNDAIEKFQAEIEQTYAEKFGFAPDIYLFEAGDGAGEITNSTEAGNL